jgi:hypothetical protein
VRVSYGEPYVVPRDADDQEIQRQTTELENRLNEMTAELDRSVHP